LVEDSVVSNKIQLKIPSSPKKESDTIIFVKKLLFERAAAKAVQDLSGIDIPDRFRVSLYGSDLSESSYFLNILRSSVAGLIANSAHLDRYTIWKSSMYLV
jgi:hypothetical protein